MKLKRIIALSVLTPFILSPFKALNDNSPISYQVTYKNACMGKLNSKNEAIYLSDYVDNPIYSLCWSYGIDPNLVKAIGIKETGLDFNAIGDNGRSFGAYQIQDAIWSNVYGNLNLFDEYESTKACCEVLRYLYDEYESTIYVLNAYNTGDPHNFNGYSEDVLCIMEDIENGKY